jgi:endonuclease/exonuclease/phosphatase family metal-dependent hydrolase
VIWFRPADVLRLNQWCSQVGSPVVQAAAMADDIQITRLLVVGWNINVGAGRVVDFVDWLRRQALPNNHGGDDGAGGTGVILLLQEAFRAGDDVPPPAAGGGIPKAIRPVRPTLDVAALGRYLGMSVAYVPSMRNGANEDRVEWEDRGSAVLSTEPMRDIQAIELPMGRQRRVAVASTITLRGNHWSLRVVAAHLDTLFGNPRGQAMELTRRLDEIAEIDPLPMLLSVDTNALGGVRDGQIQDLERAAPRMKQCPAQATTRFGLRLDYLFTTLHDTHIEQCQTMKGRYGSDHNPLVATLRFQR